MAGIGPASLNRPYRAATDQGILSNVQKHNVDNSCRAHFLELLLSGAAPIWSCSYLELLLVERYILSVCGEGEVEMARSRGARPAEAKARDERGGASLNQSEAETVRVELARVRARFSVDPA